MKKYLTHIIWAAAVIAAFAIGMYYGKSTLAGAFGGQGFGGPGAFMASRGQLGAVRGNSGGFVAGEVVAKDSQSLTVRLPNGNSTIVFYATSTSVIKPSPASVNDLAIGANIMVGGTQNSDGSLTAQSIQIRNAATSGPQY